MDGAQALKSLAAFPFGCSGASTRIDSLLPTPPPIVSPLVSAVPEPLDLTVPSGVVWLQLVLFEKTVNDRFQAMQCDYFERGYHEELIDFVQDCSCNRIHATPQIEYNPIVLRSHEL